MRIFLALLSFSLTTTALLSQKKIMTPEVYETWNKISDVKISDNGKWSLFTIHPEKGNKTLHIHNNQTGSNHRFERSAKPTFNQEGSMVLFKRMHDYDDLRELKRAKTKEKDLPKDSLIIYDLKSSKTETIAEVKTFQVPSKWNDYVVIHLEPNNENRDSTYSGPNESKENGSKLVVLNTANREKDTLEFTTSFALAKDRPGIAAFSQGDDSLLQKGVYVYDFELGRWNNISTDKRNVEDLSWRDDARLLGFKMNADTIDTDIVRYSLNLYENGTDSASMITSPTSDFLDDSYIISEHGEIQFSEDNSRIIFGVAPPPLLQDTTLLDDEIVNVEVWGYQDEMLYTRKENRLKEEKKRTYSAIYDINDKSFQLVNNEEYESILYDEDHNHKYAIALERSHFQKYLMWLGTTFFDAYRIDIETGERKQFVSKGQGNPRRSPNGDFLVWYNSMDSAYYSYDVLNDKVHQITSNSIGKFYDEQNDRPMAARSYGFAGFDKSEQWFYIYDRFDIWKIDSRGTESPQKITNGRKDKTRYRIIDLDKEESYINQGDQFMLVSFNETSREQGYHQLNHKTGKLKTLFKGPYILKRNVIKAKDADVLLTTKENFDLFPDLIVTDTEMSKMKTISEANPQQSEYKWGEVRLFKWQSYDGHAREGGLYLPEGFKKRKKYPLLVNFYERSSHLINRHRAPYAHRSTINYPYYLSKGFIIFNPDVYYRNGEPGQSCYDNVIAGVKALIKEGYIDETRIGIQGHSWGGYQIADLLTKTDIFKCAEAGAPVVNMVSAYGGIRWGSGMSRMFQYEKTQSRLGATLWEDPELYLKNSPIFNMDKVTTPVLILHNDEDGAVPWYQGIEYFTALRRLGKPAWFLNYNGDPHWPVKWQNILDFNIRMEQFFDHYLLDQPMPLWMSQGVSPMQKGIEQGLELSDKE